MKIVDWFKNVLSKIRKTDYMLDTGKEVNTEKQEEESFIPQVDISQLEHKKTREDVLMSLKDDITVRDLSEEYNYTKFSIENTSKKYDTENILSDEDLQAVACLYGAIKSGNFKEINPTDNKINNFLNQKPKNIVTLINLMIKDAQEMLENLGNENTTGTNTIGLIPGSYEDISLIIEKYQEREKIAEEQTK